MASTVGSADEVKKLQDLVKKLEKQNELLRSKADSIGSADRELSPSRNTVNKTPEFKTPENTTTAAKLKQSDSGSTNNLLESVKLLDLNLLEDDDDTWLYTSPIRVPTPEQKVVDPKAWVRQDFENPEPDEKMKTAKKALLAKLDEVSRANRNSMGPNAFVAPSQVPALSQQVAASSSASAISPRPVSPPAPTQSASAPSTAAAAVVTNHSSPSHSPQHSPSHSKSSSASSSLTNMTMVDASLGVGKLDSSPVSSPPNTPSRRERKSSEERLSFARLEDVTDVQILAKMQEESLRQATQQLPANSPRRTVSASSDQALHRAVSRTSSQSSMCSDKDDIEAEMSSPRQSNTGVVRRRPSLERLRKNTDTGKDVRRYSYGAKYPSNHVNDNGETITLAELQKLAQDKKAKRHTSSLPNLVGRSTPVKAHSVSKNSSSSEGKKSRGVKQPNNLPRKHSTASNKGNHKKIEKAKGHGGSLPNLNQRNNYPAQQQPNNSNSSHQQSTPNTTITTTEPAEPKGVKQPNSIPVKRSPTSTPNSKSGLRQPSSTKLRAASPSRSGIPVRLSMSERSAIPRPRSAIISPRYSVQASTLPRASAQNSMSKTYTRSKDNSWREGCY